MIWRMTGRVTGRVGLPLPILALAVAAGLPTIGLTAVAAHADPGLHRDEARPAGPAPRPLAPRFRAVPVRPEDYPAFGRLVFGFAHPVPFTTTRDGNKMVLRFQWPVPIGASTALPHNIGGFSGKIGQAEITLAPGQAFHAAYKGSVLVLDVFDAASAAALAAATPAREPTPAASAPSPPALSTAAAGPGTAPIEPVQATPLADAGAPAAPPHSDRPPPIDAEAAPHAAAAQPTPGPGPVALAVTRAALADGSPGAAVTVPFEAGVGLALFRRGDRVVAVFDQPRPLDVAALRTDRFFAGAEVQLLPAATVLRFTVAPDAELRAARVPEGWRLWAGPPPSPLAPIQPSVADGRLIFAAAAPGHVVIVPDAVTGNNLLVGTQTEAGQGLVVGRRGPEFAVLPTWQGVAIDPLSDRLELHGTEAGFVLSADGGAGLAVSPASPASAALEDAATLTRRFDFPGLPADRLTQRLQAAIAGAAAHPRMARLAPRRDAAQAMIALGLSAEAQALLRLAVEGDPRGATDPDIAGLSAIAAMLAGRLTEAAGIDTPALGDSDEMRFWRAVHTAQRQEGSPEAAAQFAATLPLLLAYPEAIRTRLMPLVGETLVLGGQADKAAALLAKRPDDPSLGLAKAMLLQTQGHTDDAIAAYDGLAVGSDRLRSIRAGLRAAELRLASGAIKPGEAADAESRMLYGWRGDEREHLLRLRIAALRAQAGQWRESLAVLRESDVLFGPNDPRFAAALRESVSKLLQDKSADQLDPIALVELVEDNADLLPEGSAGEAMAARLADRLDSLDLPRRADPVLERLAHTATAAAARGEFGARLAALRVSEGDAAGALSALSMSAADALSEPLVARRIMLTASATALSGKPTEALALLAPLTTPEADRARAAILERTPDWPAAQAAMTSYVAATVPAEGMLTPDQVRSVLRLSGDAAQAGDEAGLAELRKRYSERIGDAASAALFRTITAAPVRGLADIARSGREVAADRTLPQALQAMSAKK